MACVFWRPSRVVSRCWHVLVDAIMFAMLWSQMRGGKQIYSSRCVLFWSPVLVLSKEKRELYFANDVAGPAAASCCIRTDAQSRFFA